VTIGGLVIKNQSIGAASSSQGFNGVDGILGVGPTDLTLGTLNNEKNSTILTVVDNLFAQVLFPAILLSLTLMRIGYLTGNHSNT
jgi:cathepsin E